ncbi:4Fe-4S binding protein [Altibacter sp. HG106]|uniref:4Fe-4S binding protein n=1 Tax=Altibacter sp. HG106 TaxID=3023937 RepID=UPI0023501700|nr:4Fe-4S dicluster domain-containing protein [Altibacter sp. HG106]MDC7994227.1 4Fe-4S binding protein [Altibacter sp. HG106]
MSTFQRDLSLTGQPPKSINLQQKIATVIGLIGLGILALFLMNLSLPQKAIWLTSSLLLMATGVILFARAAYLNEHAGIKNHGVYFKSLSSRGFWAWVLGIALTLFYVALYWFPQYLGLVNEGDNKGLIALFDPLSRFISGNPASQWFVYGTLYTLAILTFGIKFIYKYRHNRYEIIRTFSVMFFQLSFAFLIPEFLVALQLPYYDFKNIWPLNYELFAGYKIDEFISAGTIGLIMLIFGIVSVFVITPILTYKYGKRWYCSWVCGCGGLAETAGDPFRHLSDKSTGAWKVERWVVHSVVVFVTVMTTAVVFSYLRQNESESLSEYSPLENHTVFISALDGRPLHERVRSAQDAKASAVYFINSEASETPPSLSNTQGIAIPFYVISEIENREALENVRQGATATFILDGPETTRVTVSEGTSVSFFDNLWISKEFFIWFVIGLLTLIFAWVMLFRREQLAKDARYGAIGYFVIVISILLFTYVSTPWKLFFFDAYQLRKGYGFLIGAMFSGVIGVGFYPIFGSRVWCRFGCPMAAILGFQQRLFSRFRITTNGGQCISCGNCSTYCEMGIDVRAYAQKGENIVRSSCVGCGICSAVCPRGVLKLENGPRKGRIEGKDVLLGTDVDLMNHLN